MVEKACTHCKYITEERKCPVCGSTSLSTDFIGIVIVLDPENSEIAKSMGIKTKGKYALRVR